MGTLGSSSLFHGTVLTRFHGRGFLVIHLFFINRFNPLRWRNLHHTFFNPSMFLFLDCWLGNNGEGYPLCRPWGERFKSARFNSGRFIQFLFVKFL